MKHDSTQGQGRASNVVRKLFFHVADSSRNLQNSWNTRQSLAKSQFLPAPTHGRMGEPPSASKCLEFCPAATWKSAAGNNSKEATLQLSTLTRGSGLDDDGSGLRHLNSRV